MDIKKLNMKFFKEKFNIIKKNLRKIQYNIRLLKFEKPNLAEDKDYFLVPNLRTNGINVFDKFYEHDSSAKKVLDDFNSVNPSIINKIIKDKKKIHYKSSYRVYITDLFDKDSLMSFAKSDLINRNIKQYFGFAPVIRYISVWLDRTNDEYDKGIYTQNFHRDHDDIKLIKLFYYLTDVGPDNGPFQYIKTSHKNPWLDFSNYTDNQLVSAEAKKGSLVLADTNGFHRGLKLKNGFRILVSISYSSNSPKVGFRKNIFN